MITGIFTGLGVCAFITAIAVVWILLANGMPGAASVSAIQTAMFSKLMLGAIISAAIFKLTEVDPVSYGMTVGIYSCTAFPLVAYMFARPKDTK